VAWIQGNDERTHRGQEQHWKSMLGTSGRSKPPLRLRLATMLSPCNCTDLLAAPGCGTVATYTCRGTISYWHFKASVCHVREAATTMQWLNTSKLDTTAARTHPSFASTSKLSELGCKGRRQSLSWKGLLFLEHIFNSFMHYAHTCMNTYTHTCGRRYSGRPTFTPSNAVYESLADFSRPHVH